MNIKDRLAKLEASVMATQETGFFFMTRTGYDHSEVIAFRYKVDITRTENETFIDFQSRAEIFFTQNYPEARVFIIQCLYNIDD
jgi:hypothetical protein